MSCLHRTATAVHGSSGCTKSLQLLEYISNEHDFVSLVIRSILFRYKCSKVIVRLELLKNIR